MFSRARDPDVFPASVSRYSVTIPANPAPVGRAPPFALPAALERAVPKRRTHFLAGRVCAREAIARISGGWAPAIALAQDADGCPVWPAGLVGSISHTEAFATAAVARSGEARGIGVDAEPVMSRKAAADLTGFVASEDEILRAARAGLDGLESLTLVFSAKESLFKALFPAYRRRFDYLDCELVGVDPATRRFSMRLKSPFDAAFGAAAFAGRYEAADGAVHTGVLAP
ncbi:enterobactin synthetase component D [Roseiarcus fermentans]|uniref:Enterobactin synthase component D n=1 Tax=Roseiarcus fermentans TaxID=1473586 RepID=A0A366FU90_9HYPH|nr:4'-phosphopantetheinyl transferase superfamily protein [Roseiarcus fermentans]RBP18242.1 enterobactin synthetase component D [Roseiarcus fermentans]